MNKQLKERSRDLRKNLTDAEQKLWQKLRSKQIQGNKFRKDGHGLLAQIFQHEIDHLEGVLFTDKANDIEEMLPPQAL